MRKEILIATIAGIAVGLLVAFGAWRANSAFKIKPQENLTLQQKSESVEPTKSADTLRITLANIEDYDVITESPIKIVGITGPESIIAISAEDEDFIIKSDNGGSFEQEVNLNAGINQILFSVIDGRGQNITKILTVVYSAELNEKLSVKSE